MRPNGLDALPSLVSVRAVARAVLSRATSVQDRLAGELVKHPKLVAAAHAVRGVWTSLVAAFCAMIDTHLSRYLPDLRLVAVTTASGDVELHQIVKGSATLLGSLSKVDASVRAAVAAHKWTGIELRLRPDQLLERSLSLPAASRGFLDAIIEHKLERLTPWRPERVLYGYRVLDEADAGIVSIALTATTEDFVEATLRALADLDITPTAIGPQADPLIEPLGINLLRGPGRNKSTNSRRMVSRIALASLCMLSLVWLGTSIWASSSADDEHEAEVRLLKARRLLKMASMGAVGDRERALLESKQPDNAMVVLIDRLAASIPQDTYLKELSVTPLQVRLVGISRNAPALIGQLETTGLANVRFTSVVTREKDQRDNFEITADRPTFVAAEAP